MESTNLLQQSKKERGDLLMEQKNLRQPLSKEALEVRYEKLTLKDDFMFGKVMQDERNCIDMLERLTGNKIEKISTVVGQKVIKITNDSKGVRYDIYVEDENDNVYDTEMQQKNGTADIEVLPKRARFYQGMVDLNLLESGGDYEDLKTSYVIFICTFDPFGEDLCSYQFENICVNGANISLKDGRKILIFNTKGNTINVSRETYDFLKFIDANVVSDEYTDRLSKDVSKARMNKEWGVEYMKTLLHDMDVRREGRAEGRKEEKRCVITNMLRKGMDIVDICELAECSEEYVEEVRKSL